MKPERLDRLSALLEGLAPRVTVERVQGKGPLLAFEASPLPFLHLHLLSAGRMRLKVAGACDTELEAPGIVVCRSDLAHQLEATTLDAFQHLVCARAQLEGPVADLLLREFAAPRTVSLEGAEAALRHVIGLIGAELVEPRCGQPALLDRAGDILFIGLLRHLIAHPRTSDGLLRALGDPRIARALVAIHERPEGNWTLEALAGEAGMSRTAFANTFRELLQQTPWRYLTAVRLAIAERAVRSGKGLKAAAREAGYTNASALSRALSRGAV